MTLLSIFATKHLLWISATIIFILLNIFFNKEEKGTGFMPDLMPGLRFIAYLVGYLVFWIVWLIVY